MRRGVAKITGWMQSSGLQRRAAGNGDWLARLRGERRGGEGRGGWNVEGHSWACNEASAVTGRVVGEAVVGWCLSVQVVDEGKMNRSGVRVVAIMRRVAVGRPAGGFGQAVGIRSRQEWYRYKMSRKQLVDTTGQRVQADGGSGVLVEGQEVWEERTGQTVENTEWGGMPRGSGGRWSKQCQGAGCKTWKEARCTTGVDQGRRSGRRGALVAPCYVWSRFYYPFTLF